MPTRKFENLCERKRMAIVRAMGEEFLRVPYQDIRVSRIIQRAGISRASFYLYFEGKQDLFLTLLEKLREELSSRRVEAFRENGTTFYGGMSRFLERLLEDDIGKICCQIYRQVLESDEGKKLAAPIEQLYFDSKRWNRDGRICYEALDLSFYPGLEEEQFSYALDMGQLILLKASVQYFEAGEIVSGKLRTMVEKQFMILDRGIGYQAHENRGSQPQETEREKQI